MLLELFHELISKASTIATSIDLVQKVPAQTIPQPACRLLRQRLPLLAIWIVSHWPGDRLVDQIVGFVGLEDPFHLFNPHLQFLSFFHRRGDVVEGKTSDFWKAKCLIGNNDIVLFVPIVVDGLDSGTWAAPAMLERV